MRTALIVGITGGFGQATAQALAGRGWKIRALARSPRTQDPAYEGVEWVQGDALEAEAVRAAAKGVDVVVHGANPPGYVRWRELALPMLENSIAAARGAGARLVFPGNVYNFGPETFPVIREEDPQRPQTEKGIIRVEMEQMLRRASEEGTGVLIIRAGDFFGPHAPGSWLTGGMIRPGRPVRSVTYPGAHSVGHSWAYLPDLGETVARLLEREHELQEFEVFHFRGHHFARGVNFAREVARAAGDPEMRIWSMPWGLLRLVTPFVPLIRELVKMRYLWQHDVALDNRKLVTFLGSEPHTPLDVALGETLAGQGCLPTPSARAVHNMESRSWG
jgi:nucleoside-diphosphate-sugar epimerase